METAIMELKKWITNSSNLIEQWKKEKFDVYPVDETVSFGISQTKVLGLSWETHEDYLMMDILIDQISKTCRLKYINIQVYN